MKNLAYGASFAAILAVSAPSHAVAMGDDETSSRRKYIICWAFTDSNGRYDTDHSAVVALFLMRLEEKPNQQLKDMAQDFGKEFNAIAVTNKYFPTYGQRDASCSSHETEEGVQAAAQYFRFRHSAHTQRPIVKWMPQGATGVDGTLDRPAPRKPDPGLVISNSPSTPVAPTQRASQPTPPPPRVAPPPPAFPKLPTWPVNPKRERCKNFCARPI